jgi:RNA polymerase sigma factor, sigma-70 family
MIHDKLEKKISKLKNGDVNAFDYIYEYTNRSVYFTIFYIVNDKMYAEDILQDTYIRAISVITQYEKGTNFIGWLCSIGKSLALNHLKKYRREISTDFEESVYKYGVKETELPYIFDIASKILNEDEYKIVMLCQVSGYKRREVSDMLGIPIGTVTWKNNEALKKLKNYLIKEDRL